MKYYNKINRNVLLGLRLNFNEKSYNRPSDDTPRYYLSVHSLKGVERIGKTEWSQKQGYTKYNNKIYVGVKEDYLNDDQIDSQILDNIKKTPPYGYDSSDVNAKAAYDQEVKYNLELQSFYKNYWEENSDKIVREDGLFIPIDFHQYIKNKHLVATVPNTQPTYTTTEDDYGTPKEDKIPCSEESIAVTYLEDQYGRGAFYLNGVKQDTLSLGRNKVYTFTNTNTSYTADTCHSGVLPFRFSETAEGINTTIPSQGSTYLGGIDLTNNGSTGEASEIVKLTVTSSTPNVLSYYCPLKEDLGGFVAINSDCSDNSALSWSMATPSISWSPEVSSSIAGGNLIASRVVSTGFSDHCIGNSSRGWTSFPNVDNDVAITGKTYSWEIPTNPVAVQDDTKHTRTPVGAVGIAKNGVPIYNAFDENGNLLVEPNRYADDCQGKTDSSGVYHYVKSPSCLYVDVPGEHSPIIGYAFDGYPIYGPRDDNGVIMTSSDLDAFHGHEQPGRGYHYHMTDDAPYNVGPYYKGAPNANNFDSSVKPPSSAYPKRTTTLASGVTDNRAAFLFLNDSDAFTVGNIISINPDAINNEEVLLTKYHSSESAWQIYPGLKYAHELGEEVRVISHDSAENPVVSSAFGVSLETTENLGLCCYSDASNNYGCYYIPEEACRQISGVNGVTVNCWKDASAETDWKSMSCGETRKDSLGRSIGYEDCGECNDITETPTP